MRKLAGLQKQPFPLQDTITKAIPAPTDGWDAISPLAVMPANRAPILLNWVPRPGWVELRQGYTRWSLLQSSAAVETLMAYRPAGISAANATKFFAASGSKIYDITNLGGNSSVVTGLTSARWHYVNFTPALGTPVIQLVNGKDTLRQFDGTSWSAPNITGLPNAAATSSISNIYAQKRRLWYILNNGSGVGTSVVAYMPTDAISGAIAGTVDFSALWPRGGYLISMADWTVDGGSGPNDYAAFFSSQGEVALYQGTDPTSSNTWALVGVFTLPPPISDRCTTKLGSDVGIITRQGVLPLSQSLPFDPSADRSAAVTSRIQNAMTMAAVSYANNFGWQLISFPLQNLLILNIPISENQQQFQYVMNTLTGAWAQFNGWNANCFEIYSDNLYFGDNTGIVYQAYNGGTDDVNAISADMQCAFNYLDDPGRVKRAAMIQPLLSATGSISPSLTIDTDFASAGTASFISILASGDKWDVGKWDVAKWSDDVQNLKDWRSVTGIGHAMAVRMKVQVTSQTGSLSVGQFDISVFDTAQFDGTLPNDVTLKVNAFNLVIENGGYV